MLLTREEMTLDFRGARLDPQRDRDLLQWIFNQFLYGEVTGIQVGQWLYDAPDLESARFLAKQAIEELQHISNFLNIMQMMGLRPTKPHPVVRFLATGMMADNWAEHVSMEMATGEGFVLAAFYAVIDTLDHAPTVEILKRAVRQEEGHVDFGEQQTIKLIEGNPALRRKLLGLSLVWMWGVRRLARFMQTRLPDQEALRRLPDFLALCLACNETRLQRMGVLEKPLSQLSAGYKSALVAEAYARKSGESARKALRLPSFKKRLTDTYLDDPTVQAYMRAAAE